MCTDEGLRTHDLVQINHCYVEAPGAGETVMTNDGSRIWLQNVHVRDPTGGMTVAVREKQHWLCQDAFRLLLSKVHIERPISLSRFCAACASIFQSGRQKMVVLQSLQHLEW